MSEKLEYTYPTGQRVWLTVFEARGAGFCPVCGRFMLGTDYGEHILNTYGMCPDCVDELDDEAYGTDWHGEL